MKTSDATLPGSAASEYRPDIDGLRAIAIGVVVLFHAGVPFLTGGFIGVDVFFVISGYLIGSHVYAQVVRGRFTLADFYRKRAKRILPALIAVLIFCYVVGWLLLTGHELNRLAAFSIATIFSASNIWAWLSSGYFAPAATQNPLLMTWSLGVEEQFYILFPLLMILCARASRRRLAMGTLAVTVLSFAFCILVTLRRPPLAFYLLPSRAWELSVGFLLALYEDGRPARTLYAGQRWSPASSLAGIACIAIGVYAFSSLTTFPGVAAALPVAGAALILASPRSWLNARVLSSRPFVLLGRISYSFYLWHWPLLSFANIVSDKPLSVWMGCSLVLLAAVLATLSYLWIEKPFRNSSTPTRTLLLRYAYISLSLFAVGLVLHRGHGFPGRAPSVRPAETQMASIFRNCWSDTTPNLSPGCADLSDPRPAIALLGDSHAEAIGDALKATAAASGFKLYILVKSSCPPLQNVAPYLHTAQAERECIDFNARALRFVLSRPEIKYVVLMAYWEVSTVDRISYVSAEHLHNLVPADESRRLFSVALQQTVQPLRLNKKQVVIMTDCPILRFNPVTRFSGGATPLRRQLIRTFFPSMERPVAQQEPETYDADAQAASVQIHEVADRSDASIFDAYSNLCRNNECAFSSGDLLLYEDSQHLTPLGAQKALAGLSFTRP